MNRPEAILDSMDLWGPKINGFHWEKLHPYYNGNISPYKKIVFLGAHFVVIVMIALVVNFQKKHLNL